MDIFAAGPADLESAAALTDAPAYVLGDYTGYQIDIHNLDISHAQTYYVLSNSEGTGMGAYPTMAAIDACIANWQAQKRRDE